MINKSRLYFWSKHFFFTDETKISMGSYTPDLIKLSKDIQEKQKTKNSNYPLWQLEVFAFGLSNLILFEGTENEFSYAQILFNFKDVFDKYKKIKGHLFFEQDEATPHTNASNRYLINEFFGENNLIQNPPNSLDLAYSIETLWSHIKSRK